MDTKQKKTKIQPRITLNYNMPTCMLPRLFPPIISKYSSITVICKSNSGS